MESSNIKPIFWTEEMIKYYEEYEKTNCSDAVFNVEKLHEDSGDSYLSTL